MTAPVADIIQSKRLMFDQFKYAKGPSLRFRVSGDRSDDIQIKNTGASGAGQKVLYEPGASDKSVSIK